MKGENILESIIFKKKYDYDNANFPVFLEFIDSQWSKGNEDTFEGHRVVFQDEMLVLYQYKGSTVYHVGSKVIKLEENQVLFINSREIYLLCAPGSTEGLFYLLNFKPDLLLSAAVPDRLKKDMIIPFTQNIYRFANTIDDDGCLQSEIGSHMLSIIDLFASRPAGYELEVISSIYHMFFRMLTKGKISKVTKNNIYMYSDRIEYLGNILNYIHENYNRKINEIDLSQKANMSPTHFCRFFKCVTGKSPIEYLNEYRIEQAARMLLDDRGKTLDVSLEVGFNSVNNFNKLFKKIKRCTPKEYKRRFMVPQLKPLPEGWHGQCISDLLHTGWASYDNGVFTVNGTGWDIWGKMDGFYFLHKTMDDNFSISAKLLSMQNTHPHTKVGLVVRETLTDRGKCVLFTVSPAIFLFAHRPNTGEDYFAIRETGPVSIPIYLKVTRYGNKFTAFHSFDGVNWIEFGRTTMQMEGKVYVGFGVSSHDMYNSCTAEFSEVDIRNRV